MRDSRTNTLKNIILPFLLLFIFFQPDFTFGNTLPDSLQQSLNNAAPEERLDIWTTWLKTFHGNNYETFYKSLDAACLDAKEVLKSDSSIIWCIEYQLELASQLHTAGIKKEGLQLIMDAKPVVDSIAKANNGNHRMFVLWHHAHGYYYYMNANYTKAGGIFKKSLDLNKTVDDKNLQFLNIKLLALIEYINYRHEKAEEYFKTIDSLVATKTFELSKRDIYYNRFLRAINYEKMDQLERSHLLFEDVMKNGLQHIDKSRHVRIKLMHIYNLCQTGRTLNIQNKYKEFEKELEEDGNINDKVLFYDDYSDCMASLGDIETMRYANEQYLKHAEANYRETRAGQIVELEESFNASQKEIKIKELEFEKEISESAFRNQITLISLVALFGLGILGFFLMRNTNRRKNLALILEKDQKIKETRDRLFSSITHDIRTPLALMMAPLERAEDTSKSDAVKADIQLAQRNGKRLMELFNQILDWNKAEAKAMSLNLQVGELDKTLEALCDRFQQQADEQDIVFKKDIDIPTGQFSLDYDKVDKILSNLVGNAIKFCDEGQEVALNVRLKHENGGNHLHLVVSDQGPGIDAEEQKKLFTRYVQGTQGKLKGGTGIGLALVKELTQITKGSIRLDSKLGEGATFTVAIPTQKVKEAYQPEPELIVPVSTTPEDSEKPLILIVEDEPELLTFLQSAMIDEYNVEIANSTTVGLSIAISRIPDIIISDWTLPDNNGGWLCRQLRKNELTSHIPVLILTAHNSDTNNKQALESGAVAWMNKPFKLDILRQQLTTILEQQKRVQSMWAQKPTTLVIKKNPTEMEPAVVIDPFLEKVLEEIEKKYGDEDFSVDKMAEELHLSRTQLYRKVKNLTGNTPSKLIRNVRLEKAQIMLKAGSDQTVAEIAYAVGFGDPNYFSTAYKQKFNISPTQETKDN